MTAPTAQEMGEQLLTLFQHAKLQPEREDPAERRDNQLVAQVQSYIRENYQDPFLNVSLIADRLGRNLSTLSHQYKDLTGIGLWKTFTPCAWRPPNASSQREKRCGRPRNL